MSHPARVLAHHFALAPALLVLSAPFARSQAPTVEILFPTGSAETDVAEVSVSGTADDPDGVQFITVNGVPAQSVDGYAHWSALVPVAVGSTDLVVQAGDNLGNVDPSAASTTLVRRGTFLELPIGLAYDSARDRCLVVEPYWPPRIATVDVTTGDVGVLSGKGVGSGPGLGLPTDLVVDVANDRALLAHFQPPQILSIDLTTGDRTVLASNTLGAGPLLSFPRGIELMPSGKSVLVATNIDWRVLLVDLETGARSVLTELGQGSGPEPAWIRGLTYDPSSRRAILTDPSNDRLLWLDLETGVRSHLSGPSVGMGPLFDQPVAVRMAPSGDAVLVAAERAPSQLFRVELATGNRSLASDVPSFGTRAPEVIALSPDPSGTRTFFIDEANGVLGVADSSTGVVTSVQDGSVGSGPATGLPGRSISDPAGAGLVLAIEQSDASLRSIDPASGARTIVSGQGVGSGPSIGVPLDLDRETPGPNGSLIVVEFAALWRVDRASGDRTVISSQQVGVGPMFDSAVGVVVSPAAPAAFVLDTLSFHPIQGIYRVDLNSGDRTIASANGVGYGHGYQSLQDIAIDPTGTRLWVTDGDLAMVLEVDPTTGHRWEFSGPTVGAGAALGYPGTMTLDSANQRLFVHDGGGIVSVDLATGDRTTWTRPALATGPYVWGVAGITILEDALLLSDPSLSRFLALDLAPLAGAQLLPRQRVLVSK